MWIDYANEKPKEDGIYLIVEKDRDHLYYSVATYTKDLEKSGWSCEDGNEGFFDQDFYTGELYMLNPLAWQMIERYEG